MPKLGMEAIRKAALIDAAIAMIGEAGSLDVTVSAIAKRAGVSGGLAHHYFGSKDQLFMGAMRHIMADYGGEVRAKLARAETPLERAEGIVRAGFDSENFRRETISAWLNFYVLAQSSEDAARLLRVYHARLKSNLSYALRPLLGNNAPAAARRLAAMIDGVYLHEGLSGAPEAARATAQVLSVLHREVGL